jgi:hypothetical protein
VIGSRPRPVTKAVIRIGDNRSIAPACAVVADQGSDWHCHVNLAWTARGRVSSYGGDLCCVLDAGFLVPDIKGVRPDFAIETGCQLMASGTEVAVNEGVGREKVLGLPR